MIDHRACALDVILAIDLLLGVVVGFFVGMALYVPGFAGAGAAAATVLGTAFVGIYVAWRYALHRMRGELHVYL